MMKNQTLSQEYAWFLAVPKQQDFTAPPFHLGEQVKWCFEFPNQPWQCWSGRIIGATFIPSQGWNYVISLDSLNPSDSSTTGTTVCVSAHLLQLVPNLASIRTQIQTQSEWCFTAESAATLGVSAEQLRRLRKRGLLKVGTHCRDISVPGSGLPRWQWHLNRCTQALSIPPERR